MDLKGIPPISCQVVCSFLLILFFSISVKSQNPTVQGDLKEGKPDFSLSYKNFENQALSEKETVWVVDFWASWCRPCIEALPELKKIQKKYQLNEVRFISISWDKSEESWLKAIETNQLNWSHILIPDITHTPFLDKNFKHTGIPTLFIIGSNGKRKKVSDIYFLDRMIKAAKKQKG